MDNEILKYTEEALKAEEQIRHLQKSIQELKNNIKNKVVVDNSDPAITKLSTENTKLKHRLAILNRAIASQKTPQQPKMSIKIEDSMLPILEVLKQLFSQAVAEACPDITDAPIDISLNNTNFGDYQCNSALPISKLYKELGKKAIPRDLAKRIVDNIPPNKVIDKLDIAGPGFINIFLSKKFGLESLATVFKNGVKPPPLGEKQRVLIDFSAPNIAKEMHVGHLRSTIIGDSICRLLEFLGYDVLRINHVGDWGTQFGMLIAHLQDTFPDYLQKSPPINDLQAFYKQARVRFDSDEEFKKRAYNSVVKLQSFDPNHKKAWELICDVSRKDFQRIYDRLDIKLIERGESFYQSRMEKLVKELTEKGLLEEDEGRKVLWGGTSIPFTIVKSDGGFTYDTSDLATIKQRVEEEKCDWIIYVVDAGQSLHFETLFGCAKKVGIVSSTKPRLDFVGFGVVLGEDKKKFKTRSGDTVRLHDLLEEGLKRSLEKLKEKGRHEVLTPEELKKAQESIAYGCIKYADLSHNRNHEYVFSFDKMLEDKGNTAVYLLYAYTRIKSIARNANFTPEKIKELTKTHVVSLEHDKEWKLAKVLLRFPDVLNKITKDFCLHQLCEFLYEVSTTFTEFYDACYCIEKDSSGEIVKVNHGRILLAELTALVMEKCFNILGLKPVSKM